MPVRSICEREVLSSTVSEFAIAVAAEYGFWQRNAIREKSGYFTQGRPQPARVLLGNNNRYLEDFASLYQTQ